MREQATAHGGSGAADRRILLAGKQGETFKAGNLGTKTVGENGEILLGPPQVFDKSNIDQFNF